MDLIEKLKFLRYSHDYGIDYVAYRLQISLDEYRSIESGISLPTLEQAELIGELYGIDPLDLFDPPINISQEAEVEWSELLGFEQSRQEKEDKEAIASLKEELASIKDLLSTLVEKLVH